jgi:hypothetical protein
MSIAEMTGNDPTPRDLARKLSDAARLVDGLGDAPFAASDAERQQCQQRRAIEAMQALRIVRSDVDRFLSGKGRKT